jgi:hypothetical protein
MTVGLSLSVAITRSCGIVSFGDISAAPILEFCIFSAIIIELASQSTATLYAEVEGWQDVSAGGGNWRE